MRLVSISSALNIRAAPDGKIIGELKGGDLFDCKIDAFDDVWTFGKVMTGINSGLTGFVRRKWLMQYFSDQPKMQNADRSVIANLIARRTSEFDGIHYHLGEKAKTWKALKVNGYVDCSGWIYLLAKEIIETVKVDVPQESLNTFSDEQITSLGKRNGVILSGHWLSDAMFQPGCIIGLDFAEYSWDRNRPLDIDHIVIVGEDKDGRFISQSSSSGGGVNRVPFDRWLKSTDSLRKNGRMHLVDILNQIR